MDQAHRPLAMLQANFQKVGDQVHRTVIVRTEAKAGRRALSPPKT